MARNGKSAVKKVPVVKDPSGVLWSLIDENGTEVTRHDTLRDLLNYHGTVPSDCRLFRYVLDAGPLTIQETIKATDEYENSYFDQTENEED